MQLLPWDTSLRLRLQPAIMQQPQDEAERLVMLGGRALKLRPEAVLAVSQHICAAEADACELKVECVLQVGTARTA